jgi:hypothetical protein
MLSNNFKELPPGAIPLATWHPKYLPLKPGRKGNSLFRSRKLFLIFFSWWLDIHWKNIPSPPVPDPCRPLRGCKGTNIPLIRNNFKEKNQENLRKNGKTLEFNNFNWKVFLGKGK